MPRAVNGIAKPQQNRTQSDGFEAAAQLGRQRRHHTKQRNHRITCGAMQDREGNVTRRADGPDGV
jgi:hypothetical protein